MECPSCGKPLEQRSYRGEIAVDECLWCRGVWFDPGELELYREAITSFQKEQESQHPTFEPLSGKERRHCPRCGQKTLLDGRITHIELARCCECRGVFVPGEQIAILNHNTTPSTADSVFLGSRFIDALLTILPGL